MDATCRRGLVTAGVTAAEERTRLKLRKGVMRADPTLDRADPMRLELEPADGGGAPRLVATLVSVCSLGSEASPVKMADMESQSGSCEATCGAGGVAMTTKAAQVRTMPASWAACRRDAHPPAPLEVTLLATVSACGRTSRTAVAVAASSTGSPSTACPPRVTPGAVKSSPGPRKWEQ